MSPSCNHVGPHCRWVFVNGKWMHHALCEKGQHSQAECPVQAAKAIIRGRRLTWRGRA